MNGPRSRNHHLVGFALVVLAAFGLACTNERGVRIVLITLDTLRYDRFEPAPGETSKMPLTRAHAERGTIFHRYYTVSPVTQPTHATLFSGLQPWEHGITRNGIVLPERFPTVVEVLKREGFETRAVVASFPLTQRFGFARGFDTWTEDFSHNLSANKNVWEEHWKIEGGEFFAIGDSISENALAQLGAAKSKRQFFWFHYFDPHGPYGASSGERTLRKRDIMKAIPDGRDSVDLVLGEVIALYDRDVAFLDTALDRVLRKLQEDEARFETHVIVVSDHGESLGEGDSVGHGVRLVDVELHVPAFIISPHLAAGLNNDVAATIDIAPTLLALAGVTTSDTEFEGRNLIRSGEPTSAYAMRRTFRETGMVEQRLNGVDHPLEDTLFAAIDPQGMIVRGNHEGLRNADPSDRAETLERFEAFQRAFLETDPTRELTPDVRRALEALGYVE